MNILLSFVAKAYECMTRVIANKQQPHGPIEDVVHATKNFTEE